MPGLVIPFVLGNVLIKIIMVHERDELGKNVFALIYKESFEHKIINLTRPF